MNPNDDQTTRWLAYLLGDLPPDEAAEVEAEMRDDPANPLPLALRGETSRAPVPP